MTGQSDLGVLPVADGAAFRIEYSLAGEALCDGERPEASPDALTAHTDTTTAQRQLGDLPRLSRFAEHEVAVDAIVTEADRAGRARIQADLLDRRADCESGCTFAQRHEEAAHRAVRGSDLHEDHRIRRFVGIRDEALLAVHLIVFPVGNRGGAHHLRVGTGGRFGEPEAEALPARGEVVPEFPHLSLVGESHECRPAQLAVDAEADREPSVDPREHHADEIARPHRLVAVAGEAGSEEPELGELSEDFRVHESLAIPLCCAGKKLFLGERLHGVEDELGVVIESMREQISRELGHRNFLVSGAAPHWGC